MRKIVFFLLLVVLFGSCKHDEKPVTPPEQIAGNAAVEYYGYLQRGDFASFVDGINYSKPIPKDYREALERNAARFVHEQDSVRGGIKTVKLSKADLMQNDSTLAAVYLVLGFGNKTSEEVLVPMVKRNDVWYMK